MGSFNLKIEGFKDSNKQPIVFSLEQEEIESLEFIYESNKTGDAASPVVIPLMKIKGSIDRILATNKLNMHLLRRWSKMKLDGAVETYSQDDEPDKKFTVEFVHNGLVVRTIEFLNAAIHFYKEFIKSGEGNKFVLIVKQKSNHLTDVAVDGVLISGLFADQKRYVNAEYLPLFAEADEGSQVLAVMNDGEEVVWSLEDTQPWTKVSYNGLEGYVDRMSIALEKPSPRQFTGSPKGETRISHGTQIMKLPWNGSTSLDDVPADEKVMILGESKISAGGTYWIKAQKADGGEIGWVDCMKLGMDPDGMNDSGGIVNYTMYNISLTDALEKQMEQAPQKEVGPQEWVDIDSDAVLDYLNPSKHNQGSDRYQFLDLSASAGIGEGAIQEFLSGKGILNGKANCFLDAAEKYHISEVYLVAHASHETENGTSELAKGIEVNGKIVYNMYGINAVDGAAVAEGSRFAEEMGWDTPEKAIDGGAKWISERYINNENYRQNTLYKMRWNPDSPGTHQYATDIAWAINQTSNIKAMYDEFPTAELKFDVPVYKDMED